MADVQSKNELQAEAPCYWFGVMSPCLRWRVMVVLAGGAAALDLTISWCLALTGYTMRNRELGHKRRRFVSQFPECLSIHACGYRYFSLFLCVLGHIGARTALVENMI